MLFVNVSNGPCASRIGIAKGRLFSNIFGGDI
jgi:hypothetical protein